MIRAGEPPDGHTFLYLIKAAACRPRNRELDQIHSQVTKRGFGPNEFVTCAMTGFYAGTARLGSALKLFGEIPQPGLVSWTVMIGALVSSNCPKMAMALFVEMRSETSLVPDEVALAVALCATTQTGNLSTAMAIHCLLLKTGVEIDAFLGTELVRSYATSGRLHLARQVFDEFPRKNLVLHNAMIHQLLSNGELNEALHLFEQMPHRDLISWNTVISGTSQASRSRAALELFRRMGRAGLRPNGQTLCSVLAACCAAGALETGAWAHAYIDKWRLNVDGSLDAALIDMYAKCGSVERALQVFDKMPGRRGLRPWTAMICGLAAHGRARQAVRLFGQMRAEGVRPDGVTLVGVLNACAHGGLLLEGLRIFKSMEVDFDISPEMEHYGCMINLLGRKGHLMDAYDLAMSMPMGPNAVVWGALLSACRTHNDLRVGSVVAERLIELDPFDPWARIMLSNLYGEASRWDQVGRLRREAKEVGPKKVPGCSSIEVNGRVNEFLAGGGMHPCHAELRSVLEMIRTQMRAHQSMEGQLVSFPEEDENIAF
ncbi:unnamed protein product [Spirodela intermedia]|uniref:Uncharacterized protein n=1 Tax=Spirodela intermedia TaxID=51605 RepID=A0A7I8KN69_SPIIN|nr:unnamed protein product [Spirodela intermedia]